MFCRKAMLPFGSHQAYTEDRGKTGYFRFRVYLNGIRRPTQASFSLKNSSAYVECRHCIAYRWGSLPDDAGECPYATQVALLRRITRLLVTELIKEVSPLLPNPCHFQDYDRSMLSPAQPGSEGCLPVDVGPTPSPESFRKLT